MMKTAARADGIPARLSPGRRRKPRPPTPPPRLTAYANGVLARTRLRSHQPWKATQLESVAPGVPSLGTPGSSSVPRYLRKQVCRTAQSMHKQGACPAPRANPGSKLHLGNRAALLWGGGPPQPGKMGWDAACQVPAAAATPALTRSL